VWLATIKTFQWRVDERQTFRIPLQQELSGSNRSPNHCPAGIH
jgi:hypothetical protein